MADEKKVEIIFDLTDEMSRDLKKIKAQMGNFGKTTGVSNQKVNDITASVKKLAGVIGVAFIAKKVFDFGAAITKTAGDFEQFNVAFETMLGSSEKAKVLLDDIKDFAKATPFELPSIVEGSKRLLAYNIDAKAIIPTFSTLGNIAAGVGTEKLPQLITAFGQVSAKGKLMGQELLQFTEAGVNLGGALQEAFGVSRTELEKMISTGKVSFKAVEAALESLGQGSGKFAGLMEKQSLTLQGAWSNVSDTIVQTFLALGNAILPQMKKAVGFLLAQSARIQIWAEENQKILGEYFQSFFDNIVKLGKSLFSLSRFFYNYLINPIIEAFKLPIVKWVAGITAGIWLLNAAFAALAAVNPFSWIVLGISSAIIAISFLVKNWKTVTSFFRDSILAIQDWFLNLSDRLAMIAERIGNVFKDVGKIIFLSLTGKFGEIKNAFNKLQEDIKNILTRPDEKAAQPIEAAPQPGTTTGNEALKEKLEEEKNIRQQSNDDMQQGETTRLSKLEQLQKDFSDKKREEEAKELSERIAKTEEEFARIDEKNAINIEKETENLANLKELRDIDGVDKIALENAINAKKDQIRIAQNQKDMGAEEKRLVALLKLRKEDGIENALLEKEINKQKELVQIEYNAREVAREKSKAKIIFETTTKALQDGFNALTTLLELGSEKSRAAAIALKIVRLGEATVNTYAGASRALATVPFPGSIFAASSVIASGLANVAKISGIKFAQGTISVPGIGNQDTVPSLLAPKEMVIPKTFAEGIRAGDITIGGNGTQQGVNIEVNVPLEGANLYGDPDQNFVRVLAENLSEQILNGLIPALPLARS